MEHPPQTEQLPAIDYLDENLRVSFRFEGEAVDYLPLVTAEDLESRVEKYRLLLGQVEIVEGEVNLVIQAILELQNEPVYYQEGKEAVSGVNISAIKQLVTSMDNGDSGNNLALIGDIHTHPLLPKDFENGLDPCSPSPGDIESIIADYERGALRPDEPFIFGIAGPDENGDTQYAFYRIICSNGVYGVKQVELD